MRSALIILLAVLFGFAAPALAAADDRYEDRRAKSERYERHGDRDRDGRRVERSRHRPDKHWSNRGQYKHRPDRHWSNRGRHKHSHDRYRGHGKYRGHSRKAQAYVVCRERVPVRPSFSIFLRIP